MSIIAHAKKFKAETILNNKSGNMNRLYKKPINDVKVHSQ